MRQIADKYNSMHSSPGPVFFRRTGQAAAVLICCSLLAAGMQAQSGKNISGKNISGNSISVLTYNLENLFDTRNNPDLDDDTYLPLTQKSSARHQRHCDGLEYKSWRQKCSRLDWNEQALAGKIRALVSVIAQAGYPDILVLQEVENRTVLNQLMRALAAGQYRTGVLIEGNDRRGVDQAVISRLRQKGRAVLHKRNGLPGRGVLEVPLQMPGNQMLQIFAVHLAAAYHPLSKRTEGLAALSSLIARRIGRKSQFLLAGDFNILQSEESRGGMRRYLKQWHGAHSWCRPSCIGSHYYGATRSWSWLDRILMPPDMRPGGKACWRLSPKSVRLIADAPGQLTRLGYPRSYSAVSGKGASDHLPLLAAFDNYCDED